MFVRLSVRLPVVYLSICPFVRLSVEYIIGLELDHRGEQYLVTVNVLPKFIEILNWLTKIEIRTMTVRML